MKYPKTYIGVAIDEPNQQITVATVARDKETAIKNTQERVPGIPVLVVIVGDPPAVVRAECFKFFDGLNIPRKEWKNTFQEVMTGIQELMAKSKPNKEE